MTPAQKAAIALDLGHYQEAEKLALKMTRSYPRNAFGWKILGASLIMTGRTAEALKAVENAVCLLPGDAAAHHDMGIVLYALGRHEEALESLRRAIELEHQFPEAHNNLGNMLWELGRLKEAEVCLRHATALKPEFFIAHNNLGNVLRGLGRQGEAEKHYRLAIELKPDYAEAHDNLGTTLQDLGRAEEAEAHYRRAIGLYPDHAEFYRNLADLKRFSAQDPLVGQLRRLHDKSRDETNRMHASFALAKACEDIGEYEEAFSLYEEGNRLRKGMQSYSIEQDRALFERIKIAFDPLPKVDPVPSGQVKPILIVGMPRSGTSLVEQILASHSMVFGAGELDILNELMAKHFAQGADCASKVAKEYLEEIASISPGRSHVTDKMPQNFRWLGFLLSANPEVRIIHTLRDPVATCWSIFKTYFPAKGLGFAFDLKEMAEYYRMYLDLMNFWHERFPGRIHDLDYERLTENQEEETRKMLDYCGLPWEKGCLEFEKTQRAVKTASALQVRQKLYRGSSEAWRKFDPYLGVLKDHLGIRG